MKITKLLTTFAALTTLMLSGCGKKDNEPEDKGKEDKPTPGHVHSWSDTWSSDNSYHWHTCTGCDEINDFIKHSHDVIGNCTVCGRWCGEEITLHEKVEFENIAANSKHFFRFELETPIKLKRVKTGEFNSNDIKVYRINDDDEPEIVELDGMSYTMPAASKTNYYYVVVSPVGTPVGEGSFKIEDDHSELGHLDSLGICAYSGYYTGMDVMCNQTVHFNDGPVSFVDTFEAYFRFQVQEGYKYYINFKNQLSHHGIDTIYTYARAGSTPVALEEIDWYDPAYPSSVTKTEYYSKVQEEMGDGFVYIHWVDDGTTGEEFTAEDYFTVIEEDA